MANYKHFESQQEETRRKVHNLLKTMYNYDDNNNPFGDPNLSKPFIWMKKFESYSKSKGSLDDHTSRIMFDCGTLLMKIKSAKSEIRNLQLKRSELQEHMANKKQQYNHNSETTIPYESWLEKQEKFQLAQEKLRVEIRIDEGRIKPIDFLNTVLMIWTSEIPIPKDYLEIPQYQKPYLVFDLLSLNLLNETKKDLGTHLTVEQERLRDKNFVCFELNRQKNNSKPTREEDIKFNIEFWEALIVIVESFINPEHKLSNLDESIRDEVLEIISNKSYEELTKLEIEVQESLGDLISPSDIEFWTIVKQNLEVAKMKSRLESFASQFLINHRNDLEIIREQSEKDSTKVKTQPSGSSKSTDIIVSHSNGGLSPRLHTRSDFPTDIVLTETQFKERLLNKRKLILQRQIDKWKNINKDKISAAIKPTKYDQTSNSLHETKQTSDKKQLNQEPEAQSNLSNTGSLSPTSNIKISEENSDEEVERFLNRKRTNTNIPKIHKPITANTINTESFRSSRFYLNDDTGFEHNLTNEMKMIEAQGLLAGESPFDEQVKLTESGFVPASSKYIPRKPRYFNRIRTGYEWNKYYQLHYDLDNPPPKVIQGYKFNIFYPDLIDKTNTPQYTIERSDTPDTCVLRFKAGPPYEDIAFKIVNREWDLHERSGFKNFFDRGIFYLYFNFKRYRYKR